MGQKSSKSRLKSVQQQQQSTINHPKFKNASLSKDSDYLIITLLINNETEFKNWENNLNMLTELDDQTYLLPKAYQFEKVSLCNSSGKLKIQFDDFRFILHDQLQNRRNFRKHFEEEEIWYLLYSLVVSAFHFNKMNRKVGDIRPKNIFINDSGQVKVSTIFSWPNQISNVEKTVNQKIVTYIAPQQIQQLAKGKVQKIIDRHLAESFSIGLTILNTGLLDKMENLYNVENYKFDNYLLQKKINKWLKLTFESEQGGKIVEYSNLLKQIVLALCEPDPNNRVSASQVYEWLSPYDEQIFSLQKFNASIPPVKILRINCNQPVYNKVLAQVQQQQQPIHHSQYFNSKPLNNETQPPTRAIYQNGTKQFVINSNINVSNNHQFVPQQPTNNNFIVRNDQQMFPFQDKLNVIPIKNNNSSQKREIILGRFQQMQKDLITVRKYQASVQIPSNVNGYITNQKVSRPNQFNGIQLNKQRQNQHKQANYSTSYSERKTVETKSTYSSGDQFLKKINQQLQRSKMMYP